MQSIAVGPYFFFKILAGPPPLRRDFPCLAHVDSIKWLKDPDLFYHELTKEINSNVSQLAGTTHKDPLNDKNAVINLLGAR